MAIPTNMSCFNELLGEQLGGGGGGSSDFSTAQVTVTLVDYDAEEYSCDNCPIIDDSLGSEMVYPMIYLTPPSAVFTVPLYKGKCYWELSARNVTTTGNIEEFEEGILITGDGTITLDFSQP